MSERLLVTVRLLLGTFPLFCFSPAHPEVDELTSEAVLSRRPPPPPLFCVVSCLRLFRRSSYRLHCSHELDKKPGGHARTERWRTSSASAPARRLVTLAHEDNSGANSIFLLLTLDRLWCIAGSTLVGALILQCLTSSGKSYHSSTIPP